MSVGPDTFLRVKRHVAAAEAGHARVQADEGGSGSYPTGTPYSREGSTESWTGEDLTG
jgi:hypothetical protein